ncbi:PP2C family protein-serine/threonine phosphatase [Roseimarinus sediminis]|uniref:PP2C family protein-serine/threonine phosphatase n=1 Tax=Roseimarinus sediminis TaxID=1610899 RepID=UPI003D1F67F5
MRFKKLSNQLNTAHLLYLTGTTITLLILHFFFLRVVIDQNINKQANQKAESLETIILNSINIVENNAQLLISCYEKNNEIDAKLLESVLLIQIIDSVNIVHSSDTNFELTGSEREWIFRSGSNNTFSSVYICRLSFEKQMQIVLKPSTVGVVLKKSLITPPFFYILCSATGQIVESDDEIFVGHQLVSETSLANSVEKNKEKLKVAIQSESKSQHFDAAIRYLPELDLYLLVNHTNRFFIEYLRRYPAIILLITAFILVVVGFSMIRTNNRYTRPYSDIIQSLRSSKYIGLNPKSKVSEPMLIKRSIDLLQNQLSFYVKNLEKTNKESLKFENDLKIAKSLQRNILPRSLPKLEQHPEISISALSESAYHIGGDLYDYFMLDDNRLLFAVGDISGKGIAAALFMIYTQTLLRSVAQKESRVAAIAAKLNEKLVEENISDLFVTMILAIIDMRTGALSYCNCAHNQPLVIRNEGKIDELSEVHGIPLGIYARREYKQAEIVLHPGDQLLFYTDGVIDTIDENGMNYSMDVLKYNLMGAWFLEPEPLCERLKSSVDSFRGNKDPMDDLTLLVLRYNSMGSV